MKLKDTGLTAEELKDIVKKYMVETYARYDFIAERAEGMYLYDEKGVAYLDFYGGVAVNTPGNRNPKVVAAVKDQLDDIMHTFNYPYTIPQALLAKKICDTIGMDKIFFQNSGTEANECMIKMARKYGVEKYGPEHYHIVTAINGFHGRTYGALSATGQPDNACQLGFKPMLPGFSYAEYNNLEDFKSKVTDNTIAIMIVSPMHRTMTFRLSRMHVQRTQLLSWLSLYRARVVYILQHRNLSKDFVNSVMKEVCFSFSMKYRPDGDVQDLQWHSWDMV